MKRWMIWAGIAVGATFAALLTFVMVALPDVGGEVADVTPRRTSTNVAATSVVDDDDYHPEAGDRSRDRQTEGEAMDVDRARPPIAENGPRSNPAFERAYARRMTPEARVSTQVFSKWVQVRRVLAQHADEPGVQELIDQANELMGELRDMRRESDTMDYADLESRQRQLVGVIRQYPDLSDDIGPALDSVVQVLDSFDEVAAEMEAAQEDGRGDMPFTPPLP